MFECHITKIKQDNQKWNRRSHRSPIFNNPKRSLSKPRIFKNRPISVQKMDKSHIINISVNTPLINQHQSQSSTTPIANLFEGRATNSEFQGSFASNGLSHSSYIQRLSTVKINQKHNDIQMQANYRSKEQPDDSKYSLRRQLSIKKQTVRFKYETPTPNHYFQPKVTTQAVSPSRPPRLIHQSVTKQPKFVSQIQNFSKIHEQNINSMTPMNTMEELDEKKSLNKLDDRLKQFIIENKLEKQLKVESNDYCFMDNFLNNPVHQQKPVNCLPPLSSSQHSVNIKYQISEPVPIKLSSQIITHRNYNQIINATSPIQIPQINQKMHEQQLITFPFVNRTVYYSPLQQSLFKLYASPQQLNQVQTHYIHPQQVIERQAILRNSNSSKQKQKIMIESSSSILESIKNDSVQQNQSFINKKSVNSPKNGDHNNFFSSVNSLQKIQDSNNIFPIFKKDFIHYSAQPYSNEHFPEQFRSMGSVNFRNSTISNNYDQIIRTSSVSVKQFGVENKIVKRSILSSEKNKKIVIQPQHFKPLPQKYENNRYFDQVDKQQKKVNQYEPETEQISEIIKKEQYLKYEAWSIKSEVSDRKRSVQNSITNYLELKQQEENSINLVSESFSLEQYKQCNNNQAHFHELLEPISPIRVRPAKNSKQICIALFNKQRWETRQMTIVLALIGIGLSLILFQVFK